MPPGKTTNQSRDEMFDAIAGFFKALTNLVEVFSEKVKEDKK